MYKICKCTLPFPHDDSATVLNMARRSRASAVLKDIMITAKCVWKFVARPGFVLFWPSDPPFNQMLASLLMSSEQTWQAQAVFWERAGLHNFNLKGCGELCSFECPPDGILFCLQMKSGKSLNCTTKLNFKTYKQQRTNNSTKFKKRQLK